ncbi:hypothetical protein QJS10_CPA08g01071 [Acorus calamus]|uniref:Reverse transcriptase domain-containing protein n=1 Tax=Acorus calamus TaxID=4465 RepID=A0AAV9EG66_ACOCL|nr:hypothetical protein QJS10_CPA08g01071 [Acorus calamus]
MVHPQFEQEFEAEEEYLHILKRDESLLRQKSRQLWLREGDKNSKFFYSSRKARAASNTIRKIKMEDGSFSNDPELIKAHAKEYFSSLLNKESTDPIHVLQPSANKLGSFIKSSNNIFHLIFADDLIVFTDCSLSSAVELQSLLSSFSKASGLHLNSGKSQLFCTSNSEALVEGLGIPLYNLPVHHLGLPLQSRYLSNTSCLPLINKMRKRLQSWIDVCLPKEEGGLGLKRSGEWNMAAMGTRLWEIASNHGSLWASWMNVRLEEKRPILIGLKRFGDLSTLLAGAFFVGKRDFTSFIH